MKFLAASLFALLATTALAHPGHVAAEAGHSHWVAIAATIAAVAIAAGGLLRGVLRRRRQPVND
jgi:hypothetical protein